MATTAKQIYRGMNPDMKTITDKKVAGAYLPGTFCTSSLTTLTQSTAPAGRQFLLAPLDVAGQSVATAYLSGDTAAVYELVPKEPYIARFAAATYTYGQELTIAASGRLAAAASTNIVVGFYTGTGVALAAGDLDDFVAADQYIKP